MHKLTIRTAVVACLSISLFPCASYAGFGGNMNITGFDVGDTSELIIAFTQTNICGTHQVMVPRTQPYYNDMLAIAISAYSTGKPINVWIETCNGTNPPEIFRMIQGVVW